MCDTILKLCVHLEVIYLPINTSVRTHWFVRKTQHASCMKIDVVLGVLCCAGLHIDIDCERHE